MLVKQTSSKWTSNVWEDKNAQHVTRGYIYIHELHRWIVFCGLRMTLEGFVHCKSSVDVVELLEYPLSSWIGWCCVCLLQVCFPVFKEVSNVPADGTASGVGTALSCLVWLGLVLETRADTCLCMQSHHHQWTLWGEVLDFGKYQNVNVGSEL